MSAVDSRAALETGKNFIAGQWLDPSHAEHFAQRNPADLDEVTGLWPASTPADVTRAVDAASEAFLRWSSLSVFERARILGDVLHELTDRSSLIEDVIVAENGKTRGEARGEITSALREMDHQIEQGVREYGEEIHRRSRESPP